MQLKLKFWLLGVVSLLGMSVFAADFGPADAAYRLRENNPGKIQESKGLYERILRDSSAGSHERLRAAEQLGRLAYYEGELLADEKDSGTRLRIFDMCSEQMEQIAHIQDNGHKTQTYYYWKSACVALYAKSANLFQRGMVVGTLRTALNEGLQHYTGPKGDEFEGGGMYRAAAAVFSNPGGMFGNPLYDINRASDLIDRALKVGPNYFNAHIVKAKVMKQQGKRTEALRLLQNAEERIETMMEEGKLPVGLEPETKAQLKKIREAKREM